MRNLLPLILLAACTPSAVGEFRSVLPDERLMIDTSGMAARMRGAGEPSENAVDTLGTAQGINDLLVDVLGSIEEITSYPPSWEPTERVATWGPWEDDGIEGRLWVRERRNGGYGWAFEFRFVGEGEDAWRSPVVGRIDAGSDDTNSSGTMLVDAAVWGEFDPTVTATGGGLVTYSLDEHGASANIALDDYAEEPGDDTADALISWTSAVEGGGSLDFVAVTDAEDDPGSLDELWVTHSRWLADGSGRSDVRVTGGDLGVLSFYETDCWDASLTSTFYENSYDVTRSGDEATCAFAEAEYPE